MPFYVKTVKFGASVGKIYRFSLAFKYFDYKLEVWNYLVKIKRFKILSVIFINHVKKNMDFYKVA